MIKIWCSAATGPSSQNAALFSASVQLYTPEGTNPGRFEYNFPEYTIYHLLSRSQ
jgi:hypothetical protein